MQMKCHQKINKLNSRIAKHQSIRNIVFYTIASDC